MARRASEQRYCSSCMRVTNWFYLSNYGIWQCGVCGAIYAESGPGRARSSDIPQAFRRMDIPPPRQPPPPTYRKSEGKDVLTWAILIFCLLIVGGIVTYILFSEEIKELVNGYAAGSGREPIPAIAAPTAVTTPTVPSTPRRSIPTPTTLPLTPCRNLRPYEDASRGHRNCDACHCDTRAHTHSLPYENTEANPDTNAQFRDGDGRSKGIYA